MTDTPSPRRPLRIGVDFRFLGVGRRGLERGIPRFTQEQLQAVLALDSESTYLLLCDLDADLGAIRPEIKRAPNVQVVCGPEDAVWRSKPWNHRATMLAKSSVYQRWLEGLRLDVYHATAPMVPFSLNVPNFDVCPYVVTAYDLIPLIYPVQFLSEGAEADAYHRALLFIEQATRLAAISEATARDLHEHLDLPLDRIDVTPPAPSVTFRRLPRDVTSTILAALDHPTRRASRHRARVPENYLLCIPALHYTKNLPTLLGAYALLPNAVRERFPLVVGGQLESHETPIVWHLAEQLGVQGDLILTGRVSEGELAALYNAAAVVVHPSHYEGFGLPVVEAMRCGAPVITGKRSSLPEVAGDAAILVDSDDRQALSEAIATVVQDEGLRAEMRQRGFAQAARYTPHALAEATVACYHRTAAAGHQHPTTALRVAFWSPVPPQLSGVADYAEDVTLGLASRPDIELEVFVDSGVLPPLHLMRAARIHHHSEFERRVRQAPFDVCVYQAGAALYHMYMEEAMLKHPGVLVLHDLHWSRAVYVDRLHREDGRRRFRDELAELEGEDAARKWDILVQQPENERNGTQWAFLDEHPMLGRLVAASSTCVTLTPEIGEELERRYPGSPRRVIPLGVSDPSGGPGGFDRASARSYLDLDQRAFVVSSLGLLDAAKHLESLLDGFAELLAVRPDAVLALVGWSDPGYQAALGRRAEELGIGANVRVTGGVSRRAFEAYAVASDVVVTLREQGLIQMSTAVMRALAAGRSLLMSDIPAWRSIPATACVRIAPPPHERAQVAFALASLAGNVEQRLQLERGARAYYETTGRIEDMADQYARLLFEVAGRDNPSRDAHAPTRFVADRRTVRPLPTRSGSLPYTKVCELEDFAHPQLVGLMREVCAHKRAVFGPTYPRGREHRKDWEVAMALRALADHGAVRSDARILGVAAGTEDTIFYLSRHVAEVVAVDRYLAPGEWTATAPPAMLIDPVRLAPYSCAPERLTVRHMDCRVLSFPDACFDGIFSSGSIEHFGDLQTVAAASYEMGRVLKPGGVLSLSTELLITPSADGCGVALPGTLLLSPDELRRFIVDASGLEPIGEMDLSMTHWTLSTSRNITEAVNARRSRMDAESEGGPRHEWMYWDMPHIVLEYGGQMFTSVHLTMRRAIVHPVADNSWAQPSPVLRAAVVHDAHATDAPAAAAKRMSSDELLQDVRTLAGVRAAAGKRVCALADEVEAAAASLAVTRELALELSKMLAPPRPAPPAFAPLPAVYTPDVAVSLPVGAVACPMAWELTPPFTVVVERDATDLISKAYREGEGWKVNPLLVALMLALVPPGGTVLDVGANVGSISLALAASGRRALAVEAAPVNVGLMEAAVALNRMSDRVRLFATAVGDHTGEAHFVPHGPWGRLATPEATEGIVVPLQTVDSLLAAEGVDRVDLAKIDVEGADLDVLRGMTRLLSVEPGPILIVECSPFTLGSFGVTATQLVGFLEAHGYRAYTVDGTRLIRRHAHEVQVTTVTDVLALQGELPSLPGWRVDPPLSPREVVMRFVAESLNENAICRATAAQAARALDPQLLELPEVTAALVRLTEDDDLAVREAAAWWGASLARSGRSA